MSPLADCLNHGIKNDESERRNQTACPSLRKAIRWSDEDECFVGSLPELDGDCTHGSTVEEVARNLDECAELYVEDCLTDGTPLPEPRVAVIVPAKSRTWANENAIAQLRQSRGVTQKDFARLLGVSLSTLIKWESGQRRPSGSSARLLELVSKHPELLQT